MAEPVERIWELMDKIGICMLITHRGGQMHARPMSAIVKPDEDAVYFLTDVDLAKDDEIEANPNVSLAFSDPSSQKYVTLNGHAEVSADHDKIEELWSAAAKVWFDNADDPRIRVLRVTPEEAEYWDSPGKVAAYATLMAAAVTGAKPDLGENRKVTM
jgi:general stress protein 26